MFKMYETGIYPMVEKLVKEMGNSFDFEGTSHSMYRILTLIYQIQWNYDPDVNKSMCFR